MQYYKHKLPFKFHYIQFKTKRIVKFLVKMSKKEDFEDPKVPNRDFSIKSVSD